MLTFFGGQRRYCDGVSRRDFLRVGALSIGGLSLADVLRSRATAREGSAHEAPKSGKSVIMVFLGGGPSHLDTYDMKPQAAAEFRGEFRPIRTNVPGISICELMPQQAAMMDQLAVINGMQFVEEHSAHQVMTGFPDRVRRPAFGSIASYMKKQDDGLPPYVSMMNQPMAEDPAYAGTAHRPFTPSGPGLENLSLVSSVSLERLGDRKQLLASLDKIHRDIDYGSAIAGVDAFTVRALDMIASKAAREAFDVEKEPQSVRDKYGNDNQDFLKARRLVEAGVSVVTLATGSWDTHGDNFNHLRKQLPRVDQGLAALVGDLKERGLDKDVAVVMWGEFGRTPRVNGGAGRDHWPAAGFAWLAGGGFRRGQVIGETDSHGERSKGKPYTPTNVLATLYRHLGIDPSISLVDNNGRPTYLLDDRDMVKELI